MRLMPILPAERDPRLITMRRGGTLTDEHHRLLAEWALAPGGGDLVQVWARTDPADRVSAAVAAAAGFVELGEADGTTVWARARRPAEPSR